MASELRDRPVDVLHRHLAGYAFSFTNEKELQEGLADALRQAGHLFMREVRLAPGDLADFLVVPGVCIEVKIDGGLSALTRQIHRYAQREEVRAILVVSSRSAHARLPVELNGKPVRSLVLRGGLR